MQGNRMIYLLTLVGAILLVLVLVRLVKKAARGTFDVVGDLAKGPTPEMEVDLISEIRALLGCDSEVLIGMRHPSDVMERYVDLLERGRREGFTPVILIPSPMMREVLERDGSEGLGDDEYTVEGILSRSTAVDAEEFLRLRLEEYLQDFAGDTGEGLPSDIMGEYAEFPPEPAFISVVNFGTGELGPCLIVAKIPTVNPWEAAAWIPMGGFNACPAPEEQAAVFKRWYELYGAVPAVATYDIWQTYVENPPAGREEAQKLALEQFAFCDDIVFQGVDTVNALAGTLKDAPTWYFWWD